MLHKAYYNLFSEQAKNEMVQENAKNELRRQIERNNIEIDSLGNEKIRTREKIEDIKNEVGELKKEKGELKYNSERVNKDERLKLIIGLIILIPLTVYLYLFYSSTFFSVFFRVYDAKTSLSISIFDPHALSSAYSQGVTAILLVLSGPIIFLGLGFCLHFFSVQEGWSKYLKMACLIFVTLVFDFLLAYFIAKSLYDLEALVYDDMPRYSMKLASRDTHVWIVIFCGFIVYIIWGVVFDMTMTAYQKMDTNRTRIKEINSTIATLNNEERSEKSHIADIEKGIKQYRSKNADLTALISKRLLVDVNIILSGVADFYNGWITQMTILSCPQNQLSQAHKIYNDMKEYI